MEVESTKEIERVRALPCWQGSVTIEPLSGGLSNLNFIVTDGSKRFVVRMVGGDEPLHCVMRFNELAGLKAANAIGITPGIVYDEPGLMVIDHIDGKTLNAEDICKIENLNRSEFRARRWFPMVPRVGGWFGHGPVHGLATRFLNVTDKSTSEKYMQQL